MDLGLENKVVGITGGSTGIGEAAALAFAREGAKVAACGRSVENLHAIQARFSQEGLPLYTESVDVGDLPQLERFVRNTAAH